MKELRQELIEAQKGRLQLVQWKLLIVSALAATGLGFTGSVALPNSELVLCCIPFACLYADALLYHQGMVANVIGEFLRTHAHSSSQEELKLMAAYEEFALRARSLTDEHGRAVSAYALERLAVATTTNCVSALVAGAYFAFSGNFRFAFGAAGATGIAGSWLLRSAYLERRSRLRGRPTEKHASFEETNGG